MAVETIMVENPAPSPSYIPNNEKSPPERRATSSTTGGKGGGQALLRSELLHFWQAPRWKFWLEHFSCSQPTEPQRLHFIVVEPQGNFVLPEGTCPLHCIRHLLVLDYFARSRARITCTGDHFVPVRVVCPSSLSLPAILPRESPSDRHVSIFGTRSA
jgi:hypothetical protein